MGHTNDTDKDVLWRRHDDVIDSAGDGSDRGI